MTIENVSSLDFEAAVLQEKRPTLVDFWAPWCAPCRAVAPILDKIDKQHDNLKIVKLNIDDYPDVANQYSVMSIPSMIVFVDGHARGQIVGAQSKVKIEELIAAAIART